MSFAPSLLPARRGLVLQRCISFLAFVTMTTNTTGYNNVHLLAYISLGQKSDMNVICKISGLAELCSLLEDIRVNPCSYLFQFPEATHMPCLMAPCLHL